MELQKNASLFSVLKEILSDEANEALVDDPLLCILISGVADVMSVVSVSSLI